MSSPRRKPISDGDPVQHVTTPREQPGSRTDPKHRPDATARRRPWAGAARVAVLSASDCLALIISGGLAYLLWARPVHGQPVTLYLPAAIFALLVALAYGQARLYPGFGLGPVETLRRYWMITTAAFLGIGFLVFALKLENLYSRLTLALALGFSLLLVPLLRMLVLRAARRLAWWPEPAAIVADAEGFERISDVLDTSTSQDFRAAGWIQFEAAGSSVEDLLQRAMRFADEGVGIAFTVPGMDAGAMDRLRSVFPRLIVLQELRALPVEGVQIRNLGRVLGLEYANNLLNRQSRWLKRALDLGLAATSLVLSLPLILVAMAAVKHFSRGPALFWHTREGRKGRPISVPKIRTMVPDAERQMEELLRSDQALRAEWASAFKLKDDPRLIPVVGRFLRRFSIDELPQLWSVVRGDMSLVGPRPFPAYHLEALSPHARRLRDEVRPGITGLWQVTARGEAGVQKQQAHDIYYIRNWSVWLDLYILAKTVQVVFLGRGAY